VNSKQRSCGSLSISKWPFLVFCLWKATDADGTRHQPGVVIMTVSSVVRVACQRKELEEAKTRFGL
jgi:hypothetical protein